MQRKWSGIFLKFVAAWRDEGEGTVRHLLAPVQVLDLILTENIFIFPVPPVFGHIIARIGRRPKSVYDGFYIYNDYRI